MHGATIKKKQVLFCDAQQCSKQRHSPTSSNTNVLKVEKKKLF
jgi:hypothetical protein